jgi:hypothetical protein
MFTINKSEAAAAWTAELGAVLAAQRATFEFERRFASTARREQLSRDLFAARVVETSLAKSPDSPESLVKATDMAVNGLETGSSALYPLLDTDKDLDQQGVLSLVCAVYWQARLADERTRACFTAAREGRKLSGFDDAVEMAAETEQCLLALRRFEGLLQRGGDWLEPDKNWLRLRSVATAGRLRLHAAVLKALEAQALERPLPPALAEQVSEIKSPEISLCDGLAWRAAGFSAAEIMDWREAGLLRPAQAHAWYCHGFSPTEADAWSKAGLLPDESGIYVHGGASELETALALHKALGDVERLLPWYRARFEIQEILRLLGEGVRTPDQALSLRAKALAPPEPEVKADAPAPAAHAAQEAQAAPAAGEAPEAPAAGKAPKESEPAAKPAGKALPPLPALDDLDRALGPLPKPPPLPSFGLSSAVPVPPPALLPGTVPPPRVAPPVAAFDDFAKEFGIAAPVPAPAKAVAPSGAPASVTDAGAPTAAEPQGAAPKVEVPQAGPPQAAVLNAKAPQAADSEAEAPDTKVPQVAAVKAEPPKSEAPQTGAAAATEIPPLPAPPSLPEASAPAPQAPGFSWIVERVRRSFGLDGLDEAAAWKAVPPGGGVWMGWGVPSANPLPGQGQPPAVCLPLGSGSFDLAVASEGLAFAGKPFQPDTFFADEAWQTAIDALRAARGDVGAEGQWCVFAWPPARALLLWGLVYPPGPPPWSTAVDYEERESWPHRWDRKTDEWGEAGMQSPCMIGRTLDQGWWVAMEEGLQPKPAGEVAPVDTNWNKATWWDTFQDFCLKMEIPVKHPHWNLVAGREESAK